MTERHDDIVTALLARLGRAGKVKITIAVTVVLALALALDATALAEAWPVPPAALLYLAGPLTAALGFAADRLVRHAAGRRGRDDR